MLVELTDLISMFLRVDSSHEFRGEMKRFLDSRTAEERGEIYRYLQSKESESRKGVGEKSNESEKTQPKSPRKLSGMQLSTEFSGKRTVLSYIILPF